MCEPRKFTFCNRLSPSLPNILRLSNLPHKIMKQKVVIKLGCCMNNHKLRSKALKIAVGCSGVEAARLKGEERDEIEVIGEGLDIVELTNLLRKCVPHAELLTVTPIIKQESKTQDTNKSNTQPDHHHHPQIVPYYYYPIHHQCRTSYQYQYQDPYYCSIM